MGQMGQMGHKGKSVHDRSTFSVKARCKSFRYAFDGFRIFLCSQHNAWIHLLATAVVVVAAILFHVSKAEGLALIFAVGFVWVTELFNTVIEKIMDFISVEIKPEIKLIKDLSAAAVLLAAITAWLIGCIVFIPKLFLWFGIHLFV